MTRWQRELLTDPSDQYLESWIDQYVASTKLTLKLQLSDICKMTSVFGSLLPARFGSCMSIKAWHRILAPFVAFSTLGPSLIFPPHFFIFQRPSITFPIPLWLRWLSACLFSTMSRCRSIGLVGFIQSALVTLSKMAATKYTTS